jgi:hypothetical protein
MKTDKLLHLIQQKKVMRSGGALPLPKAQQGMVDYYFNTPKSSVKKESQIGGCPTGWIKDPITKKCIRDTSHIPDINQKPEENLDQYLYLTDQLNPIEKTRFEVIRALKKIRGNDPTAPKTSLIQNIRQTGGQEGNPIEFEEHYWQSPAFLKRLSNFSNDQNQLNSAQKFFTENIKNAQIDYSDNPKAFSVTFGPYESDPDYLKNLNLFNLKKNYDEDKPTILISKKEAKDVGSTLEDVLNHEKGHLRTLNPEEGYEFLNINSNLSEDDREKIKRVRDKYEGITPWEIADNLAHIRDPQDKQNTSHLLGPTENYSDLNVLRNLMYQNKIYDAASGDITLDILKNALDNPTIKNSFAVKRLLKSFTPEQIMYLNNKIADIGSPQTLDMARQGGSLHKAQDGYEQLKNKYIDEAILEKPLQKGVIQIPNPKFDSSIDNLPNRKKQAIVDALGNPRYMYLDGTCEEGDCNSFHYFNTPKQATLQEYQKSQSMPVHKNGGSLPIAQSGKPIYVTDPNDPRLKSYNDSLSLYNNGIQLAKNVGNFTDKDIEDAKNYSSSYYVNPNDVWNSMVNNRYALPSGKLADNLYNKILTTKIFPTDYITANDIKFNNTGIYPLFDKPKQKVILDTGIVYQEPPPLMRGKTEFKDLVLPTEEYDMQPVREQAPQGSSQPMLRMVPNPKFNVGKGKRSKEAIVDQLGNPKYVYYNGDKVIGKEEYSKLWDEQNKFAEGGSLPIAQSGIPTYADSLALYNNALAKIKFYQNNPDYIKQPGVVNYKDPTVRKNLIKLSNSTAGDRSISDPLINSMINNKIRSGRPFTAKELRDIRKTNGQNRFGRVSGTGLTSFGDIVEDGTKADPSVGVWDDWFNPLAPPIYLHPNISPQGSEVYYSATLGDLSDIPYYDPLAVKPEDMLTDEERIERAKKYPNSLKNSPHDVENIDYAPVRTFKDMLPEFATEEKLKPMSNIPLYVPETVRRVMNPKFNSDIDFLPNRTKEAVVDSLGNPRYKYYNGDKVISEKEYKKLSKKQSGGSSDYEQAKAQYIKASSMGPMGEKQMQDLVRQYPQIANDASLAGTRSVGNAALNRANEEHNRIETNTLGQVLSTPQSRYIASRQEAVAKNPGLYNVEDYKLGIQEPGAPNDITDDPIAMAILATATGGVGLGARGAGALASDFAGNLASEATFGGYDFANSGFKLSKDLFKKETLDNLKTGFKNFKENPRLAIAKWRYPEGTLQGDYVRHFETSVLPENVKDGRIPTYVGRASQDVFNDNKAAAANLNDTLKRRITELESQEGFNRLVNQETEYLRSIGFNKSNLSGNLPKSMTDDDAILHQATQNAKEAVDRMKNVHNMNELILDEVNTAMQSNANFTGKDLEAILTKYGYPLYNALANSGGKIIPPFITIGYGYGNNVSAIEHEIMHILQHNREMPIDQQLKFLETADNLTPDQQAAYDYFMNGKITNTVPGKSLEPAPFLAEIRNLMKEHGFIQNTYDPINPQMMEQAYDFFKKNPQFSYFTHKDTGPLFRSDQRIFDFMKPSKTNFNILSSLMNKLPAVAGAGLVGAGMMNAASNSGTEQEQKQKKGGVVKAQKGLANFGYENRMPRESTSTMYTPPTGYSHPKVYPPSTWFEDLILGAVPYLGDAVDFGRGTAALKEGDNAHAFVNYLGAAMPLVAGATLQNGYDALGDYLHDYYINTPAKPKKAKGGPTSKKSNAQQQYFQLLINQKNKK